VSKGAPVAAGAGDKQHGQMLGLEIGGDCALGEVRKIECVC
jgi:hypothetical protein